MKQTIKLLSVIAVVVSSIHLVSTATAADSWRGPGPGFRGGSGPNQHGGPVAGYRGGPASGYNGNSGHFQRGGSGYSYYGKSYGYRGPYYGNPYYYRGHQGGYRGWCGGSGWGFSLSYAYRPPPSYYYCFAYPYQPVYYSPSVVYVDPPSSSSAYVSPAPVSVPKTSVSGQPLGIADIEALTKEGISEEVIISQIRNSHAVFHLTTAEIIKLKNGRVSEKVIDFMINTANP
jgi:hypothetical protein